MANKKTPSCLFRFKSNGRDGAGGLINMEHVRMTRWNGNAVQELAVFFENGPHVLLDDVEGKRFEEAMTEYHNFDYLAAELTRVE